MWTRVKPNYTVCISGISPPLMGNPSQQHGSCLSWALPLSSRLAEWPAWEDSCRGGGSSANHSYLLAAHQLESTVCFTRRGFDARALVKSILALLSLLNRYAFPERPPPQGPDYPVISALQLCVKSKIKVREIRSQAWSYELLLFLYIHVS